MTEKVWERKTVRKKTDRFEGEGYLLQLKPMHNFGKTKKTKMLTDLHITYMV